MVSWSKYFKFGIFKIFWPKKTYLPFQSDFFLFQILSSFFAVWSILIFIDCLHGMVDIAKSARWHYYNHYKPSSFFCCMFSKSIEKFVSFCEPFLHQFYRFKFGWLRQKAPSTLWRPFDMRSFTITLKLWSNFIRFNNVKPSNMRLDIFSVKVSKSQVFLDLWTISNLSCRLSLILLLVNLTNSKLLVVILLLDSLTSSSKRFYKEFSRL